MKFLGVNSVENSLSDTDLNRRVQDLEAQVAERKKKLAQLEKNGSTLTKADIEKKNVDFLTYYVS